MVGVDFCTDNEDEEEKGKDKYDGFDEEGEYRDEEDDKGLYHQKNNGHKVKESKDYQDILQQHPIVSLGDDVYFSVLTVGVMLLFVAG